MSSSPLREVPDSHVSGEQKNDTYNIQGAFEFVRIWTFRQTSQNNREIDSVQNTVDREDRLLSPVEQEQGVS